MRKLNKKCLKIKALIFVIAAFLLLSSFLITSAYCDEPLLFLGDESYQPYEWIEDGSPKGLNVDICNALSKVINREINIELVPWGKAQGKVLSGEADGLIELDISEESRKLYDLTSPTIEWAYHFFIKKDKVTIVNNRDVEGKRIGVTKGGYPKKFLEKDPKINLIVVKDSLEGIHLVESEGIDAFAGDMWVTAFLIQKHGINKITMIEKPFVSKEGAFAVRKGNTALLREIDAGIKKLKKDGTLTRIKNKWKGKEIVFFTKKKFQAYLYTGVILALSIIVVLLIIFIASLKKQITARKKVEETVQKQKYYLEKAQEIGVIGTWELDIQKNILIWTDENYKIFGVPLGTEMNYEIFLHCVHPDDRDYVNEKWSAGLNKEPYDIEHRLIVDDKVKWVREKADIEFDTEGNPIIAIGVTQEITERKRVEESLLESEVMFKGIFSQAPVGIELYDSAGNLINVNQKCLNIFGVRHVEEIKGFKLFEDPNISAESKTQLRNGEPIAYESEFDFEIVKKSKLYKTTRSGKCFLHVQITPYEIPDRGNKGFVVHVQDINERKQAEEELKKYRDHLEELVEERTNELKEKTDKTEESRKALTYLVEDVNKARKDLEKANRDIGAVNRELQDFAYIVSHDLKAPLRAVSQLAYWISQDYAEVLDEDGKEHLNLLKGRVKRMDGLINGILQYSRLGRAKEKQDKIDLAKTIPSVLETLTPPENIRITIEDELPEIVGNNTHMEQVFQNLIGNAIKFMDKPEGLITIGCRDKGSRWEFRITDNGPGIDEKYHERIFKIFQTLVPRDEHESTGIGLTLVKKTIEQYDGKVWVESEVGKGSSFVFTLPKK